jgi:hypothetical protein
MRQHGRWRRVLAGMLLAAGLVSGSGCLCYLHPIPAPDRDVIEPCRGSPKCARDHVYIFFVHGMDPLDMANLTGLRDHVQDLGFHKTYYGQLYHGPLFDREIRRIHEEDPEARFVLVGFSFGANVVRTLAQSVRGDGIPIDLLVYLGGNTLKNVPYDQPDNVIHLVNILASGFIWNGDNMEAAENISEPDVWHFGSPTHQGTRETLARELAEVVSHVPVEEPADVPATSPEAAPTPRPVTPAPAGPRDEWDFLKPVSRLRQPPPVPGSSPSAVTAKDKADSPYGVIQRTGGVR